MDDSIPSISTEGVGSRFVSQNEIDTAKARRDEQWKAAYARCGALNNIRSAFSMFLTFFFV
jgi:hypothetical protein